MISKVEGPGGVRGASPVRKAGKTERAGSANFSQHMQEESVAAASSLSGMASVASVSALIGIQEVEDATERAAKGKKRANLLLNKLDELRLALISGTLTKEQLLNLSTMVQNQRAQVDDPGLAALLDDIDLRARVELAKYGF